MVLRIAHRLVPDFDRGLGRLDRGAGGDASRGERGVGASAPCLEAGGCLSFVSHRFVMPKASFGVTGLERAGRVERSGGLFKAALDPVGETRRVETLDWRQAQLGGERTQDWLGAGKFARLSLQRSFPRQQTIARAEPLGETT